MEETRDPATQCCWSDAKVPSRHAVLRIRRYAAKSAKAVHWKSGNKIGCKRKGVWIRVVQHPVHR
jgi:hypothetical protein